jgi:hypothetical protein
VLPQATHRHAPPLPAAHSCKLTRTQHVELQLGNPLGGDRRTRPAVCHRKLCRAQPSTPTQGGRGARASRRSSVGSPRAAEAAEVLPAVSSAAAAHLREWPKGHVFFTSTTSTSQPPPAAGIAALLAGLAPQLPPPPLWAAPGAVLPASWMRASRPSMSQGPTGKEGVAAGASDVRPACCAASWRGGASAPAAGCPPSSGGVPCRMSASGEAPMGGRLPGAKPQAGGSRCSCRWQRPTSASWLRGNAPATCSSAAAS